MTDSVQMIIVVRCAVKANHSTEAVPNWVGIFIFQKYFVVNAYKVTNIRIQEFG